MSFMLFMPTDPQLHWGIKINWGGQFLRGCDLDLGHPRKLHRALGDEKKELVLL